MGAKDSAAGATLLASLAFFTVGTNLLSYGVVQQPIMSQLNLSLTYSGLLVSVFFVSYAAMQIPAGYASDRWGGERTIAVFTTITGLAALGFSFVNSFLIALLLRMAIGFGTGALLPGAVRALTNRMRGHQLEVANGFFGAGWGVSQIVVLNALPIVLVLSNWRISLELVGLTTLGVSGFAWWMATGSRRGGAPATEKSRMRLRETFTSRTLLLVLINVTGITIPVVTTTWAPIQFEELFKITLIEGARIVSIFGVITVIAAILGGVAVKAIGGKYVMVISMAAGLVGFLLLSNPANPVLGLFTVGMLGFAAMFYISANFSMVPGSAPAGSSNPGFVFGVYNTISNAVSFFPPLISAYILDTTHNFPLLYGSMSLIAVAGFASSLLLRKGSA